MTPRKPELSTTPTKIDKLISRIDAGEIKIPAFQRGYVWKQNQVIELMESIFKDYPIGSILLWEAAEADKLKSERNVAGYKIPDRGENWPVNYVLDGQQRISSIYGVFSANSEQIANDYNPNVDIFEIYYDFDSQTFLSKSEIPGNKSKSIVPLRHMIDPIKLIDEISSLKKEHHDAAKILSSKFLNYEVPVVHIKSRTKEEVGVIFERINNTVTRLNTLDLMTAWTWTEDFHLIDSINELTDELESKGFGGIDPKLILQNIAGMTIGSTKTENILKLTGDRVRDNWDKFCNSIRLSIDLLSTDLKCRHIDFLPYHQQLTGLVRFYSRSSKPSAEQLKAIKSLFWRTSFSNRYSSGQTTAKMDADIEVFDEFLNYNYVNLLEYNVTIDSKDLIFTQFSKSNPTTRAFLLLMAQFQPLDLTNGQSIDLNNALSLYNRSEFHHVFPNSYLIKHGFKKGKRFSLMNFCFLPSLSNKQIGSNPPSKYMLEITPANLKPKILESNLLPIDSDTYSNLNYEDFLSERARIVLGKIDELIEHPGA